MVMVLVRLCKRMRRQVAREAQEMKEWKATRLLAKSRQSVGELTAH
jgi:hypothetical protein